MQRDGQSEQAGVEKKKADHAEKCLPIFEIDFSPRRNQWRNDLRIDNKIEHGCALRIEPEGFGQFRQRLVEFRLSIINDSECGVRELVLGRERDRFLQGQLGSFKFATAKINYAKIRERIKIVRRLGQNFL